MSPKNKIVAILDVDGVLYDYVGHLAAVAASHLNRPIEDFPPALVWNFFSDQWGLTLQEYLALVDVGVRDYGLIQLGLPFDSAIEGVDLLLTAAVEVHIATDLGTEGDPKGHRKARLGWLANYGITTDIVPVTFTPDKHDVAAEYVAKGYDVFALEDKVENFQKLNAAGATGYLLNQEWNRHENTTFRVDTVLDFAKIVVAAQKNSPSLV
jgi:hypothetical protein